LNQCDASRCVEDMELPETKRIFPKTTVAHTHDERKHTRIERNGLRHVICKIWQKSFAVIGILRHAIWNF
jgi:hypothetical protein